MSGCALSPDSLIRTFPCHTGVERPVLLDLLMMTLLDLRTGVDTDLLLLFTFGLPTESAFCWRRVRISRPAAPRRAAGGAGAPSAGTCRRESRPLRRSGGACTRPGTRRHRRAHGGRAVRP